MLTIAFIASYLLGSLSFGVLAGRIRGLEVRERDLPGGSGVYRTLGPLWGIGVAVLDLLKGAIAAWWSLGFSDPLAIGALALAVVAGHVWPVFFGFSGGGGIAPALGFFLLRFTEPTLIAVGIALVVIVLYWRWYWQTSRKGVYPIPVGTAVGVVVLLGLLANEPAGLVTALAAAVVMGIRGLQILQRKNA